eukprot:gnl/MRDRNA2_/MRDRNA2_102741_c0_seq1.p1 gnl/MRDRNA2_/MRDRNA2_102741_c0~~gnl/MRDRNA2_/MRDRNA2_102741_c0_seq1.p1  ORF type:complete len:505 (-),score=99.94 gnl/MRDRNA2_/MRDRNA2_102741_c0_seq1:142-1656(-)
MMQSAIFLVLYNFVVQSSIASELEADKLPKTEVKATSYNGHLQSLSSLFHHLKKMSASHNTDLDHTTLGKPAPLGIRHTKGSVLPSRSFTSTPLQISSIHPEHHQPTHTISIQCKPTVLKALNDLGKKDNKRRGAAAPQSRSVSEPLTEEDKQKEVEEILDSRAVADSLQNEKVFSLLQQEKEGIEKDLPDKKQLGQEQEDNEKKNVGAAAITLRKPLSLTDSAKSYYKEISGAEVDPDLLEAAPSDFFELLGLDRENEEMTAKEVKAAYRKLARISHPDIAGEAATPLSVILNIAYKTLMNDDQRAAYAEQVKYMKERMGGTFDGRPRSIWAGPEDETRAVFVDESVCIGCTLCNTWAPGAFTMGDGGRARCKVQWGEDEEGLQIAMDMCPVDCIHWVRRDQVAVLEYAMKGCSLENVATMGVRRGGNMGEAPASMSPWWQAERLLQMRKNARQTYTSRKGEPNIEGSGHDEVLAGAIAAAWLGLPQEVRQKGWPGWELAHTA